VVSLEEKKPFFFSFFFLSLSVTGKMGADLSKDLVVHIACVGNLSGQDIWHALAVNRELFRFFSSNEVWKSLCLLRYGSFEEERNKELFKALTLSDWRFSSALTCGGKLDEARCTFVAQNVRLGSTNDTLPIERTKDECDLPDGFDLSSLMMKDFSPSGWQLAVAERKLQPHRRYYFEIELLWANPIYGDIAISFADTQDRPLPTRAEWNKDGAKTLKEPPSR
jgi:hypothetical protein